MTQAKKNQLITHLYNTQHKWLLACAFNLTKSQDKAEELVQDLYVKLLDMEDLTKIIYDGDSLNQHYLYKMLKSLFIKSTKLPTTSAITPVIEDTKEGDAYTDEESIEHKMIDYVNEALEQVHFFDKILFQHYVNDGHSIMSLHKATKISTSTIWSSQQKLKKFVKAYVNEKLKNDG